MARVELHVRRDAAAVLALRAEQLRERVQLRPGLVTVLEPGPVAGELLARCAADGTDLSRLRVRFAHGLLRSEPRGYESAAHPASTAFFAQQRMLAVMTPGRRPIDWVLLPEFLVSCEELELALAEDPPEEAGRGIIGTGLGNIGVLAMLRRSCVAYEQLLQSQPPELLVFELGPMPCPGYALCADPSTDPALGTHVARLSAEQRETRAPAFGGDPDAVPPYGLSIGPSVFRPEAELWVTVLGSEHSDALVVAFGDIDESAFALRSPYAAAFACGRICVACDEAAAEELLGSEGREALIARYARAGHQLVLFEED